MGAGNSPALACRFGLSLLRMLREQAPVFQGVLLENTWRAQFAVQGYDPTLGYGAVMVHPNTGPANEQREGL